jgi:hypothetical protein
MKSTACITLVAFCASLVTVPLTAQDHLRESKQHDYKTIDLGSPLTLTCTLAPCLLPNVQASPGPKSATDYPLAANPNNAMQLFTAANDLNCGSTVGQYASDDGGTTWKHACMKLGKGATQGLGGPVGDYDLNGNLFSGDIQTFIMGNARSAVFVSKSTDNGTTWGTPVEAVPAALGYILAKPWLEIDKNAKSLFKNNIYISSSQFAQMATQVEIFVSHSSDAGVTWTTKAVDPAQNSPIVDYFSNLATGADGTVYVSWMRCSGTGTLSECAGTDASMLISKSLDAGNTWTPPVTVATAALAPDASANCFYGALPVTSDVCVSNVPVTAVTGSGLTATVYVTFYNWTGTQMQVEVAKSTDGGTTWGAPVRVSTSASGDEFLPWINLDATGKKIAVTWLDRRNDAANKLYQPFFASSHNGTTWGNNHAISATKSDPNKGSDSNGVAIGDHRAHRWVGKTVYAVWPDTRTGSAQCEVGGIQLP